MEKDISWWYKLNKVEVAMLRSDKLRFRIRNIIGDENDHFTMLKGWIIQENITVLNMRLITELQNSYSKNW